MVSILKMYVRVTRERPCPVCGKDSWCLISKGGKSVLCQRVESDSRKGIWGFYHRLNMPISIPPHMKTAVVEKLAPEVIETLVMGWIADMTFPLMRALALDLGVHVNSLERLGVGWNDRKKCYSFPMRNSDFEHVGARYRFPDGEKRSLRGGSEGLFLPLSSVGGNQLFVTEGPTDCAALLDCGLDAIGRPNNVGGIDEVVDIVERYKPRSVVIVDDSDKAGAMGGARLETRLRELHCSFSLSRIRPTVLKDARDCVRSGGRRQFILEALDGFNNRFWELISV